MGIFQEFVGKNPGKIIGILLGLIFGYLAIKYGLLKALFVAACVCAGFYIGKRLDENIDFKILLNKYFGDDK
jgi:uncharacterized membrane protein